MECTCEYLGVPCPHHRATQVEDSDNTQRGWD